MTDIKEASLQDLDNVTGGAAAEFGQLAQALYATPIAKFPPVFESTTNLAANSELVLYIKEQLAKNYAIDADFNLASDKGINTFIDKITGQHLSFSDVLTKIHLG